MWVRDGESLPGESIRGLFRGEVRLRGLVWSGTRRWILDFVLASARFEL